MEHKPAVVVMLTNVEENGKVWLLCIKTANNLHNGALVQDCYNLCHNLHGYVLHGFTLISCIIHRSFSALVFMYKTLHFANVLLITCMIAAQM